MAATKTLAQMRAMVRELADQETNDPSNAFVDNTELDDRINEWLTRLYDLLIQSRGQEYYADSYSWTSVASQSQYTLPTDFYSLLGVRVTDGNEWHDVQTWEYRELVSLLRLESQGGGASSIYEYHYRLKPEALEVHPYPKGTAHTFWIDYVPAMPELTSQNDTFDGVNGWEKWAAYGAAIDLALKEENFELAQLLRGQQGVVQQQIEALGGERDGGRPPRITDTAGDWADSYGWWFGLEPPP